MKNYKIENNIDFYAELNRDLSVLEETLQQQNLENDKICLLTQCPLQDNYITLDCSHNFNYLPLYHEVCKQKNRNYLETTVLLFNEIKCPYCRLITEKLLPYLACFDNYAQLKRGVNYPLKYTMKLFDCEWKIRSGKNKNMNCGRSAYKTDNGIYCFHHHHLIEIKKKCNPETIYTAKHDEIKRRFKIKELKEILKNNNLKISGTKIVLVNRCIINNINQIYI